MYSEATTVTTASSDIFSVNNNSNVISRRGRLRTINSFCVSVGCSAIKYRGTIVGWQTKFTISREIVETFGLTKGHRVQVLSNSDRPGYIVIDFDPPVGIKTTTLGQTGETKQLFVLVTNLYDHPVKITPYLNPEMNNGRNNETPLIDVASKRVALILPKVDFVPMTFH